MIAHRTNLPPEMWGKLIRQRRELLGFTQTQLAEACGVSRISILRIEQGRQTPRLELMEKLADALRTETSALFPYPKRER